WLHNLTTDSKRVGDASNDVLVVVAFGMVRRLSVVHTDANDPVVTGSLEAALHQVFETLPNLRGRVIKEQTDVALVRQGAVDGVGTVQRRPVLARLHVLEAVGNLGLSHPLPNLFAPLVQVGVPVAYLSE